MMAKKGGASAPIYNTPKNEVNSDVAKKDFLSNHKKVSLAAIPITIETANNFIKANHRHHGPVQGFKFAIGAVNIDNNQLVAVATVGRPVSRVLDDGLTAEVTRLCSDGTYNACSFLYSRCAKICERMGYTKVVTYILETESGTSLKATGWKDKGPAGGGSWSCPSRPRTDRSPTMMKRRYEISFQQEVV